MNNTEETADHPPHRLLVINEQAQESLRPGPCFGEVKTIVANARPIADVLAEATDFKPDCIRCDDVDSSAALALDLGDELSIPVILHLGQTPGRASDLLKRVSLVIASSEFVAEQVIRAGADPATVVTVHDSVDRELFNPHGEVAEGGPGNPRLLVLSECCSKLEVESALAACAEVVRKLPDLRLTVLGQADPPTAAFASHVQTDTPESRARWLRWADGLLLPAVSDQSLLVAAQALASATPCIAPAHAAIREVLSDGWDSVLFDASTSGGLVRAIRDFAAPGKAARLATPARTGSEPFDASVVQRREAGIYRTLLQTDWPLLSVILPTYNREAKLPHAVRNILGQDYPNLELIVVNDGSTDGTGQLLQELQADLNDNRLRVVTRPNGGLPTALNTGFAEAKGDYWTWASDDNLYHPGALKALARELEIDPAIGLVYADMLMVDDHGRERLFQCGPPERLEQHTTIGLCFMYRAEIAEQVGEYDPELYLAEDYDYWLRMRKHTKLRWLPRVLFTFADASDTLTHTRFRAVGDMRLKLLTREFGDRADWPQMKFEHFLHFSSLGKNMGAVGASLHNALAAVRQRPTAWAAWRALLRTLVPMPLLRLTRKWRSLNGSSRAT